MLSGVLCFRRPPPSGPIVSNFLDGIKRGRNVTGASYGARTNDGIVTDLDTLSRRLAPMCCTLRREQIHGDAFCDGEDDEERTGPCSTAIERSLFVYGDQSVPPRRWISFHVGSLDRVHTGVRSAEGRSGWTELFPTAEYLIEQHHFCKSSCLLKDQFFNCTRFQKPIDKQRVCHQRKN